MTKKKAIFVGIAVVVLLILVVVLRGILGGSKSKGLNYYDTMVGIFSNELGSFKYTFSVQTSPKGSGGTLEVGTEAVEGGTELLEGDVESEEATDSKNEFTDWDKYAEVSATDWQYPSYSVTIEGCTMSLEPLQTRFTVSVATGRYNDKFTEVVVTDGNYYIDVASMTDWYAASGDGYLISLGENLPKGSKWLVIPESEFGVYSTYAEVGERSLSEAKSLKEMYQRMLVKLLTIESAVKSAVGTEGMTNDTEAVSIVLQGDKALGVLNAVKSIADKSGDFYSSVIASGKEKGLYTDSQYEQALREKDNFMEALRPLSVLMNTTDLSSCGLEVSGTARSFQNSSGNSTIEGSLSYRFSSDTADHVFSFSGYRSGDTQTIEVPEGSQMNGVDFSVFVKALYDSVGYFNTTAIQTSVQLEANPDAIHASVIDQFVRIVNEAGTAGYYVTKNNVLDFIKKYSGSEAWETDEDRINAQMVKDLGVSLNDIVSGIVVEKELDIEDTIEQYPDIYIDEDMGYVHIRYNEEESDATLVVLDIEAINKSADEDRTFVFTNYSLRTLLNSVYPANNETLLRNHDNMFDMDKLVTEVTLKPREWGSWQLYFVISDDGGHMDLYSDNNKINTVIQY